MQYRLIVDSCSDKLERKVNSLLAKGYKPLGGINITNQGNYNMRYAQSLIKEEPNVKETII